MFAPGLVKGCIVRRCLAVSADVKPWADKSTAQPSDTISRLPYGRLCLLPALSVNNYRKVSCPRGQTPYWCCWLHAMFPYCRRCLRDMQCGI
jgi:hypothetical protein